MCKVIALCWHSDNSLIKSAGGYTRFWEIAKRATSPLVIIDKYPSLYSNLNNPHITIHTYLSPQIYSRTVLNKILDRLLTPFLIIKVVLGLKLNHQIIYVPFSELPQLTIAAVILKFLISSKLVLCNLNTNIYFLDRLVNVYLHKLADRVITISHELARALKRTGIYASGVNGVGFDLLPYRQFPKAKKRYDAVFVGRHTLEKGILDLLEAWSQLSHSPTLITVGEIPNYLEPEIIRRVNQLGLGRHVIIMGKISEQEKLGLMSQSKICVFPSYQEGWGIVPMEALSLGLPVVIYNLPVYKESLGDSPALKLVNIGNKPALSRQIAHTLKHYRKYSLLAAKWRPRYNWETIARKEWELICN